MTEVELSNLIPDGEKQRPFTSAIFDLAGDGYVEEEWFLRGDAPTYGPAPGTAFDRAQYDGNWSTVPTGTASSPPACWCGDPSDSAGFDGTVVLEWLNVSGGIDLDPVWAPGLRGDAARRERLDRCVGPTRGRQRPAARARLLAAAQALGSGALRHARTSPTTTCRTGSSPLRHGLARAGELTAGVTRRRRDRGRVVAVGQSARHLRQWGASARTCDRRASSSTVVSAPRAPPFAADVASPDPARLPTPISRRPVLVLESEFDTLRIVAGARNPTRSVPAVGARRARRTRTSSSSAR